MDIRKVRVEEIDPDPDQPRRDIPEDEIKQMALSIRDQGLLQPPIVFCVGKRYQLADGHRRRAALCLLGQEETTVLVLPQKPTAEKLLETQLTANILRKDLTPMEKARGVERLKKLRNCSNSEVANTLHISEAAVTQCLSYLTLPPEVQSDLDIGKIAGSTAYAITRAADEETKRSLLQAAKNGTLSRDDALKAVSKRDPSTVKSFRISCCLPGTVVTVSSNVSLGMTDLESLWRQLIREGKRATKQGLDVATFERVLADQSRAKKCL